MQTGELALNIMANGGVATVHLAGELDLVTAPALRQALSALYNDGAKMLVLDLRELAFVDSTGLSEFVVALRHCRDRGGDVVLQSPTGLTSRVLHISGLDQVFTIVDGNGPAGN